MIESVRGFIQVLSAFFVGEMKNYNSEKSIQFEIEKSNADEVVVLREIGHLIACWILENKAKMNARLNLEKSASGQNENNDEVDVL